MSLASIANTPKKLIKNKYQLTHSANSHVMIEKSQKFKDETRVFRQAKSKLSLCMDAPFRKKGFFINKIHRKIFRF